ncbi:hypothetical protein EJ04DRAFT_520089 [Polyplosphaeria fusca]|uniref:Uncharacterized protein n=1 Tax=Polyplosphaeria fusca TaxID=682080 RepID=A0A9P4R8G2_9PLEO|nr:hypothetical protein EJ04DRAFT_520089 [Polyplosphaeria fusca]
MPPPLHHSTPQPRPEPLVLHESRKPPWPTTQMHTQRGRPGRLRNTRPTAAGAGLGPPAGRLHTTGSGAGRAGDPEARRRCSMRQWGARWRRDALAPPMGKRSTQHLQDVTSPGPQAPNPFHELPDGSQRQPAPALVEPACPRDNSTDTRLTGGARPSRGTCGLDVRCSMLDSCPRHSPSRPRALSWRLRR